MTDPEPDFPIAELHEYLGAQLDAEVTHTDILHDGLNLSIEISLEGQNMSYVLRRPNKLRHTDLFTDVRQEYRLLQRLEGTSVPAPRPTLFCEDESIIGDRFFVMTKLDGEPVPLGTDLPERFRTPAARRVVAEGLIDTLAALHSPDPQRFEGVCDPQPPGEQVAATVKRLDAATRVTGHEVPTLRNAAEWLQRNVPPDPETTLVHGDFRPGNVLFGGTDGPEVTGVLDWETAMLGGPLTELGYLLLRWRDDGDPTPSLDAIEARHPDADVIDELRETNRQGLAPFTNRAGSPSRRDLIDRYEEQTGFDVEHERFYPALGAVGLGTVWEDLYRYQVEAGEKSNREPYIEYMGLLAESIVSGEFRL